jgi:hypothetical protein
LIASLPMYDWEEVRPSTDRFWALIRTGLGRAGIAAPVDLHRGDPWPVWSDPGLVLSQTCGFPYRTHLHGRVVLVGTPDYGLPDVPAGYYYSALVVHRDRAGDWTEFLSGRLAINGADSQSGWAAPQNHAAAFDARFHDLLETGSHLESARAVAEGRADIAAVDAVTWRFIQRFRNRTAARLRVLATTAPTPGLPMITAAGNDAAAIAAAVGAAINDLDAPDRAALGLRGLVAIPAEAYLAVPTPPAPGAAGDQFVRCG